MPCRFGSQGPKFHRKFFPRVNNLKIAFFGCQWQQPLLECPLENLVAKSGFQVKDKPDSVSVSN